MRVCQDLQLFEPVTEIELKDCVFCKSIVLAMHSASLLVLVPKTTVKPRQAANLWAGEERTYHGGRRIVFKWEPNCEPDFIHFDLERGTSLAGHLARLNEAAELTTSIYFDESIEPKTKYYYRIRSVNASGLVSDWSDILSIMTSDND